MHPCHTRLKLLEMFPTVAGADQDKSVTTDLPLGFALRPLQHKPGIANHLKVGLGALARGCEVVADEDGIGGV